MPRPARRRRPSRRAGPVCPITCPLCGVKMWSMRIVTEYGRTTARMTCSRHCPGTIKLMDRQVVPAYGPALVMLGGVKHRRPTPEAVPI